MPPNKPQSDYSKKPIKRIRLLKIGPQKSKSLFEEYFYGFAIAISVVVTILGKAGGLSSYDAVVIGLWVGGFLWCARVFRRYRGGQASPGRIEKSTQAFQTPPQVSAKPLSANFKPMIGPQWPLKAVPGAARPAQRSISQHKRQRSRRKRQERPAQAPGGQANPINQRFLTKRQTRPAG